MKEQHTKKPDVSIHQLIVILTGYILGITFTVMTLIFLLAAHLSGTTTTHIIWNHYGEMMLETILFPLLFIIEIIGFSTLLTRLSQLQKQAKKPKIPTTEKEGKTYGYN